MRGECGGDPGAVAVEEAVQGLEPGDAPVRRGGQVGWTTAKSASPRSVRQHPPDDRCCTFTGRTCLSATLFVKPTARLVVNRRMVSRWTSNRVARVRACPARTLQSLVGLSVRARGQGAGVEPVDGAQVVLGQGVSSVDAGGGASRWASVRVSAIAWAHSCPAGSASWMPRRSMRTCFESCRRVCGLGVRGMVTVWSWRLPRVIHAGTRPI